VIGGLASVALLAWFAGRSQGDREEEEAARDYYDAHGRWPDES